MGEKKRRRGKSDKRRYEKRLRTKKKSGSQRVKESWGGEGRRVKQYWENGTSWPFFPGYGLKVQRSIKFCTKDLEKQEPGLGVLLKEEE